MYYLYIIKCKDGSLYTGVTTDVERRMAEHSAGTGAKYTRAKGVESLVYQEQCGTRSEAQQREYAVKILSRAEKLRLISEHRG